MKLERRIIQIGNLPPVTHYGTEKAYNDAVKHLKEEMQVKVNDLEKKSTAEEISRSKRERFTEKQMRQIYDKYCEVKAKNVSQQEILAALMPLTQQSKWITRDLICKLRKKYGIPNGFKCEKCGTIDSSQFAFRHGAGSNMCITCRNLHDREIRRRSYHNVKNKNL